jgi:hypothetical protein
VSLPPLEQVARRRGSRPRVEIQRERKLSIPHLPLPAHTLGSRALGRTPSLTDGADGDTFTPARHAHKTRTHGHRTMPRACVFLLSKQQAASSKPQAHSNQKSLSVVLLIIIACRNRSALDTRKETSLALLQPLLLPLPRADALHLPLRGLARLIRALLLQALQVRVVRAPV